MMSLAEQEYDQRTSVFLILSMFTGSLPVLMKALGQGPTRAGAAHCILSRLLDKRVLSEEQVAVSASLMAGMQGLHRLSVMLRPAYREEEEEEAAVGKVSFKLEHPMLWCL